MSTAVSEFLNGANAHFALASDERQAIIINRIRHQQTPTIDAELFDEYNERLHRGVNSVFSSAGGELSDSLKANVSEFAAYKSYHATQAIANADDADEATRIMHQHNRWLSAEYQATVARSRTAKQWQTFEKHKDTLPCIRWIPSRSVHVREEHTPFYNRIWRKDDPFWATHQPGNCYGCKCDWAETYDEPTGGNPRPSEDVTPGLGGNPAQTGKIFSADHPYFKVNSTEKKIIDVFYENEILYTIIPTQRGIVRIHQKHGKTEAKSNTETATLLANKHGYKIDLLPTGKERTADTYNRTLDTKQEYKSITKGTNNAIQEAIRKAKRQANSIVLILSLDIRLGILQHAIVDRVSRCPNITDITIIIGNTDATYTKEQIVKGDFKISRDDFK